MGCRTCTPARAAMTPVMMGNKEPPICAKRKTKASAVACISGGKSLEPTETPVAKMGPVKKPMKLTAMEAAMMLGTLEGVLGIEMVSVGWGYLQPEDQLQGECEDAVDEDHSALTEAVCRLSQQESA